MLPSSWGMMDFQIFNLHLFVLAVFPYDRDWPKPEVQI